MNVLQTLSDPNKDLTPAEIRLGKGQKTKKLTKTENRHEKILLGDLYADKEFLRYMEQKLGITFLTLSFLMWVFHSKTFLNIFGAFNTLILIN